MKALVLFLTSYHPWMTQTELLFSMEHLALVVRLDDTAPPEIRYGTSIQHSLTFPFHNISTVGGTSLLA